MTRPVAGREPGAGLVLGAAVVDPGVVARYRSKLVTVPGSSCTWWRGAVSGQGHGRFWVAGRQVVIAHRFAFALARGVQALEQADVLGHRCDNPLCQRIHPDHVVVSSPAANRREWAARRDLSGSPLTDPRGSSGRARALRDLLRRDPVLVAAELDRVRRHCGEQPTLW